MNWPLIAQEIFTNSIRITLVLSGIIIPLMLGLALLRDSQLLDRAAGFLRPVMRRLNLSNRAAYPLLAGLFLGIVFGSGVIISFAKDGSLTKRDLLLVLVFLGICHSIIEDTVVFVALGANGWILMGVRFSLAVLVAFTVSLLVRPQAGAVTIKPQ